MSGYETTTYLQLGWSGNESSPANRLYFECSRENYTAVPLFMKIVVTILMSASVKMMHNIKINPIYS